MSSIDESLVAYLLTKSNITDLVGSTGVIQAHVPQNRAMPYVWINRGSSETEDDLSANPSSATQFYESFDVECVSDDLDEAQTLAKEIKKLNKTRTGTFGDGSASLFVSDHSDHYLPKNTSGDDGRHVATADLEVVGYTE